MARDAYLFLIPLILLAILFLLLGWGYPALLPALLALFVGFFFRDPERRIPEDPMAIVSPADGKVLKVEGRSEGTFISIFLSIFNVHVNRSPVAGRIERCEHRSGKFRLAFDDRASVENEQVIFEIGDIRFSLIAGLVARRIIPWKEQGDVVRKGDRIALIRFGSRVDMLIPSGVDVDVKPGSRVRGGTSILARRKEQA